MPVRKLAAVLIGAALAAATLTPGPASAVTPATGSGTAEDPYVVEVPTVVDPGVRARSTIGPDYDQDGHEGECELGDLEAPAVRVTDRGFDLSVPDPMYAGYRMTVSFTPDSTGASGPAPSTCADGTWHYSYPGATIEPEYAIDGAFYRVVYLPSTASKHVRWRLGYRIGWDVSTYLDKAGHKLGPRPLDAGTDRIWSWISPVQIAGWQRRPFEVQRRQVSQVHGRWHTGPWRHYSTVTTDAAGRADVRMTGGWRVRGYQIDAIYRGSAVPSPYRVVLPQVDGAPGRPVTYAYFDCYCGPLEHARDHGWVDPWKKPAPGEVK